MVVARKVINYQNEDCLEGSAYNKNGNYIGSISPYASAMEIKEQFEEDSYDIFTCI